MYKFEIHLHTNGCSACGVSSGEEMVDAAVKNGYSGIVITNHFYHGNTAIDRGLDWKDFVGEYEKDYLRAKNYGERKGITVFFGLEEGFAIGKEMLIYGISPQDLILCPEFPRFSAAKKSRFVRSNGGLCICAHPFRHRDYIPDPDTPPDPDLFDGIEGFNLANTSEDNEMAMIFAVNNKKVITSGGDVHNAAKFGGAGIAFDTPVKSYADFLCRLKNAEFKLIGPGGTN